MIILWHKPIVNEDGLMPVFGKLQVVWKIEWKYTSQSTVTDFPPASTKDGMPKTPQPGTEVRFW